MTERLRAGSRLLGELLITAGVVVLLFVVYQLFWTGVSTGAAQDALRGQLQRQWRAPAGAGPTAAGAGPDVVATPSASAPAAAPVEGRPFAVLTIPRLGPDASWVVVEGVATRDLAEGPGHYPGTAVPGQVGNVAVAGHRATHGAPFRDLDRLRAGDAVSVRTASATYTYVVDRSEIVLPTDTGVLLPVPGRPGARPTQRLLTLTTCNPRWASTHRLVVHTHLRDVRPTAGAES